MKTLKKKCAITLSCLSISLISMLIINANSRKNVVYAKDLNNNFYEGSVVLIKEAKGNADTKLAEEVRKASIVFDDMTLDELAEKLERSMNSDLKGKGRLFASYSIELGLDPYLALAITLHETGCAYSCSSLLRTHNNLGGLKGSNGRYMSFETLDDGIKGYLDILYNRYYSKGLTTPELMNPVYAESTTWASKVNWYIQKIKAA